MQFFVQTANIPGISLGELVIPTPYKDIPYVGDKVTYENLTIQFIVDEHLENYIEMHNWMIGIGFPKSRQQFTNFRSTTSNTSNAGGSVKHKLILERLDCQFQKDLCILMQLLQYYQIKIIHL